MTTQAERVNTQLGPPSTLVLTEPQVAWIAALIDGEGNVGIWRERDLARKGGYKYRPSIRISNTNFDLIARIKALIPDCYVHVDRSAQRRNPKHRLCYSIWVSRRMIPTLLELVKSWLIVKVGQANLVLAFCRASLESPLHQTDHELFEQLYLECKLLNRRGIK